MENIMTNQTPVGGDYPHKLSHLIAHRHQEGPKIWQRQCRYNFKKMLNRNTPNTPNTPYTPSYIESVEKGYDYVTEFRCNTRYVGKAGFRYDALCASYSQKYPCRRFYNDLAESVVESYHRFMPLHWMLPFFKGQEGPKCKLKVNESPSLWNDFARIFYIIGAEEKNAWTIGIKHRAFIKHLLKSPYLIREKKEDKKDA